MALQRPECRYGAYYCEENIWHLAQDPRLPPGRRHVLFITNEVRQALLFHQRAGQAEGFVLWDYHVVLLVEAETGPTVYDLDSLLPFPVSLPDYVAHTFGNRAEVPPPLHAQFRLLPATDFVARFFSDRSHMRNEEGHWMQLPPGWPCIGEGLTPEERWPLAAMLELAEHRPGEVLGVDALLARFHV